MAKKPNDLTDIINTMIAEAGSDPNGLAAVASVISNRARDFKMDPGAVVRQPGQFAGYSNPGQASVQAQGLQSLRDQAEQIWSGVIDGTIADPTNGGTQFRTEGTSIGDAPNGTKVIGGNVFALGNRGGDTTALDAANTLADGGGVDQTVMSPLGYSSQIHSIAVNPDGTPADINVPLPRERPNPADVVQSSYSRMLAASRLSTDPPLTSHQVTTLRYDPVTGTFSSAQPATPAAGVPRGARGTAKLQDIHDQQNALGDLQQQLRETGYIQTQPQTGAGEFQVPLDYRPAVADQVTAPRAAASTVLQDVHDTRDTTTQVVSQAKPAAATLQDIHDKNATTPASFIGDSVGTGPAFLPGAGDNAAFSREGKDNLNLRAPQLQAPPPPNSPSNAYAAQKYEDRLVQTQIVNPAYTQWSLNATATKKLQDIHDTRDTATMLAEASAAANAAPPKFLTKQVTVRVPVGRAPSPRTSHIVPAVAGAGVIIRPPQAPPAPTQTFPGQTYLNTVGVNTQNLTIGQQMNALQNAIEGSSRNADGSRGFM